MEKPDSSSDLERVYREKKGGLLSWAAKASRSMLDAEDLVQDAFAKALSDADELTDVDDLAAWLFTAVRNRVRDRWRRGKTRSRAGEVDVSDEVVAEIVEASGLEPEGLFAQAELMEALYAAIEELPEAQRVVIEAQVLDGFTFKDLAEMSGISPDTLAARKRYAVKRLSESLREWFV